MALPPHRAGTIPSLFARARRMPPQSVPAARQPALPPHPAGRRDPAENTAAAHAWPADRQFQAGRLHAIDASPARDAGGSARSRAIPFIDRLRGVAAVVIMLHHLVGYVPAADRSLPLPAVVHDAIYWHGGLAAQVFLVIGGFVGGLSLSRATPSLGGLGRYLVSRYLRLALPAAATLLAAILASTVVPRAWSAFPLFDHFSWPAVVAHLLLVQDLLGYPSLLTGFWYLPIDWQCSGLLALLFVAHAAIVRRHPGLGAAGRIATFLGLSLPVACLSLFSWNGDPAHEPFATHYFGLVFLGAIGALAVVGRLPAAVFWGYAAACAAAVVLRGRPQAAVALIAGVVIYLMARWTRPAPGRFNLLDGLGRISYSLFLVHYPTIWCMASLGRGLGGDDPAAVAAWTVASVPASLVAAVLLHRGVELPAVALAGRFRERREP